MKIAVMGGTGLIGSQVVTILNAAGHEALPYSLSNGVDLITGEGLDGALKGADVVDDVVDNVIETALEYGGEVTFVSDGFLVDHDRIALVTRF